MGELALLTNTGMVHTGFSGWFFWVWDIPASSEEEKQNTDDINNENN